MKKNLLFGAMAMGLLFTGCSSDDVLEPNSGQTMEKDQTFYVNMRISGDVPGSRADGEPDSFAAGTGSESTVTSAYFVFYDADGNVVGEVTPIDLKDENWADGETPVDKVYKDVVSVTLLKGEKKPTQCICYINPINPGTLNVPLDKIQQHTVENVYRTQTVDGTPNQRIFAMSNSVFYESTSSDSPQFAVQIQPGELYESYDDALKAATTVDIYVERYASKLSFKVNFDADANKGVYATRTRIYTDDENFTTADVVLTFKPQYWAVNAEANKEYVIKSYLHETFDASADKDAKNYGYEELNAIINDGLTGNNVWTWNKSTYNRSYWGMSPAYFTKVYPEVQSDLTLITASGNELNQKYITYNELKNANNGIGYPATDATAHYFRETTVGKKALESQNPAAAMPSVIYVGQYSITVGGTAVTDGTPFYTYRTGNVNVNGEVVTRPYVYFNNNNNSLESSVTGGGSLLKRMLIVCSTLYKAVEVTVGEGVDAETKTEYVALSPFDEEDATLLANWLTISEISPAVKEAYNPTSETALKIQANARTLQFKSAPGASANLYVLNNNGYQQVVEDIVTIGANEEKIHLTDANVALMKNVGVAYSYHLGHAYFNIPVKHLGWYRKGNANTDATFSWDNVRVGDFGMVRNHSYEIEVNKIEGLAEGIGGDDVEIVPPSASTTYHMAYTVNILRWALVPTQKTNL